MISSYVYIYILLLTCKGGWGQSGQNIHRGLPDWSRATTRSATAVGVYMPLEFTRDDFFSNVIGHKTDVRGF